MSKSTTPILLLPLLTLSCADGGSEDRPQSEVRIAATHHLFGFRSQPGFTSFPLTPSETLPDRGTLNLFDDSTYTVTRPSGTSPADSYALSKNGTFSVLVTGSGREPSVVFSGGYGLKTDAHQFFFTDRVSNPSSRSLGMFYGTRVRPGVNEMAGGWHLMSLHAIFSPTNVLEARNVGRGARGQLMVATGDPGTSRDITGSGSESSGLQMAYGGSLQYLLSNGNGDGKVNLTVSYRDTRLPASNADSRVFQAAAGKDMILGVDADETDGEAGILFMVRHFDTQNAPATTADVAGNYWVGAYTLFVNPTEPGSDAAVGRLSLTAQNGFRFDMVGSRGIDFTYTGTYTLAENGAMELTVNGTNESWFAAVTPDGQSIAVIDDFVETRANNTPELNIFLGTRESLPDTP